MLSFRTHRLAHVALVALALLPAAACDDESEPTAPSVQADVVPLTPTQLDRDAVASSVGAIDASWATMDAARFAANFSTDARYIGPTGIVLNGRTAIEQAHTMLFGGPFRGSRRSSAIDDVVFLSSVTAIVERTGDLTGFAGTPAGLPQAQPGVVRTRERLVLQKRDGSWTIVRAQLTAVPPT